MSIQSADGGRGNAVPQWQEFPELNKAAAGNNANASSSGATGFSQLVESFGSLLKEYAGNAGSASPAAQTNGTAAPTSAETALEELFGTPGAKFSGSDTPVPGSQSANSPSTAGSGIASAARAAANVATSTSASSSGSSSSSGAPVPKISEDNPSQMCTLVQAQAVQAAFPNSTLEIWTDSGPVAASSMTGIGADQPMPYVIAYGTNSVSGGPNLYYAGVIVNEGQQALQQTGYGSMTAGDYYVWNNTPNANGVTGVTDAGSSFAQFAQYYAQQLMAGNPVNPDIYTQNV